MPSSIESETFNIFSSIIWYLDRFFSRKTVLNKLTYTDKKFADFYLPLFNITNRSSAAINPTTLNHLKKISRKFVEYSLVSLLFISILGIYLVSHSLYPIALATITIVTLLFLFIIIPAAILKSMLLRVYDNAYVQLSLIKQGKYILLIQSYFLIWIIYIFYQSNVYYFGILSILIILALSISYYVIFTSNIKFVENRLFKKSKLKIHAKAITKYTEISGEILEIGEYLILRSNEKGVNYTWSIRWHEIINLSSISNL